MITGSDPSDLFKQSSLSKYVFWNDVKWLGSIILTRTTCGIVEVGFVEGPFASLLQFLYYCIHLISQLLQLLLLLFNLFVCHNTIRYHFQNQKSRKVP